MLFHPKWAIDNRTVDVYKDYSEGVGSFARPSGVEPSIVGPSTLVRPRTPI